jgi:phage-related protein
MATFPSVTPTYGAQKSSAPNFRIARFGDGYEQRTTFGLNQNPKEWDLTWNVSETDADTIETFLDARAADGASLTGPLGRIHGIQMGLPAVEQVNSLLESRHDHSNIPPGI